MMTMLIGIVNEATERERCDAYAEYGDLHSLNEGYGVLAEEIDEVQERIHDVMHYFNKLVRLIREAPTDLRSHLGLLRINAELSACECIQVAAVAQRFIDLIDKMQLEGADAG